MTVIAKPHSNNNNFAICPFINKYKDKIMVIEGFEGVETGCSLLNNTNLEAIVYYSKKGKHIHTKVTGLNKRFRALNVEVLYMDPTTSHCPIETVPDYTWREHYIIIVQRRDTLHRARTQLRGTKYFDTWDPFAIIPPNQ